MPRVKLHSPAALESAIAELLWEYLQPDPDVPDRRLTAFGSKTKEGLTNAIAHIVCEHQAAACGL